MRSERPLRPPKSATAARALVLVTLLSSLGCPRVGSDRSGRLRWSKDADTVVLRVSREGGMAARRLAFTLYGSGEVVMEQRTGNFTRLLERRSARLADSEIAELLAGLADAGVPDWNDDVLRQAPLVQQIPKVADGSTLVVRLSLESCPPLDAPVETVTRVPPRSLARHAPVLETIEPVVAIWVLEERLRAYWEHAPIDRNSGL